MNLLKNKNTQVCYVLIPLLIVVISYLINTNFRGKLLTIALSESFFWLTVPILFFSIVVFSLKESTFKSWTKFTNYFFIISLVIILLTPTSTHGLDFVPLVKETVTIFLAILYSIISLVLIIYKSLKKE